MYFQNYPIIRFLICLLLGRIIGQYLDIDLYFYILLAIGSFLLLLFYIRPHILGFIRWYWIGIITSLLLIIVGIITSPSENAGDVSTNRPIVFSALVKKILKNSNGRQSVLFDCIASDSVKTMSFKAVAYCKSDAVSGALLPGDKFIVNTRLNPYKETGNPYSFEYSKYMASNGVFYSFFINTRNCKRVGSAYNYRRFFHKLRMKAEERLNALQLPPSEYAIISALLLGNKDHLDYEQKQAFSDSGSMHILAVSGLHLGVIFMLVTLVLGRITRSWLGVLKVIIAVIILWLYASVSGLSPSIVRASIMLSVFLISKLVSNKYNVYHTLAIAAFIILIGNPYALFNVGFWLSFLAVGSIIYFFPLINRLIYFRKPWNKFIWDIVSVSLAAQVGTVLLSIFTFKFFPLWFLISNLLMLPILPMLLLSALLIVLTPINSFMAILFSGVLSEGLQYINEVTNFVSKLPYARFSLVQIGYYEMLGLYGVLLSLVLWRNYKRSIYLHVGLLMIIMVLCLNITNFIDARTQNLFVVANVRDNSLIINTEGERGFVTSNDTLIDYAVKQVIGPIQLEESLDSLVYRISESEILIPFVTAEKNLLLINGACENIASDVRKLSTDVVVITNKTPFSTIKELITLDKVLLIFDSSWTRRGLRNVKSIGRKDVHFVIDEGAYLLIDQV